MAKILGMTHAVHVKCEVIGKSCMAKYNKIE